MLAGEESDTDGEPKTGFTIGQQRLRLFLPCSEQPGLERFPADLHTGVDIFSEHFCQGL